jgi:hypothetical protein
MESRRAAPSLTGIASFTTSMRLLPPAQGRVISPHRESEFTRWPQGLTTAAEYSGSHPQLAAMRAPANSRRSRRTIRPEIAIWSRSVADPWGWRAPSRRYARKSAWRWVRAGAIQIREICAGHSGWPRAGVRHRAWCLQCRRAIGERCPGRRYAWPGVARPAGSAGVAGLPAWFRRLARPAASRSDRARTDPGASVGKEHRWLRL